VDSRVGAARENPGFAFFFRGGHHVRHQSREMDRHSHSLRKDVWEASQMKKKKRVSLLPQKGSVAT
jgi:hypothetical protein